MPAIIPARPVEGKITHSRVKLARGKYICFTILLLLLEVNGLPKRILATFERNVSVKLPAEIDDMLEATAKGKGVSKSTLMRRAIENYILDSGLTLKDFLSVSLDHTSRLFWELYIFEQFVAAEFTALTLALQNVQGLTKEDRRLLKDAYDLAVNTSRRAKEEMAEVKKLLKESQKSLKAMVEALSKRMEGAE